MGILDRLLKRKGKQNEGEIKEEVQTGPTELEKLCAGNSEVLEALRDTMFLDPTKIDVSLEDALTNAKEMEEAKDKLRAAMWYRIAGGLAIYEGDVSKVREYFGKYAKLTGKKLKILEVTEEAVKKAQEYYQKYLKEK